MTYDDHGSASADYHKDFSASAETELRRIVREKDARIKALEHDVRELKKELKELKGQGVVPLRVPARAVR